MPPRRDSDAWKRAEALAPRIRERAAEIDADARLPDDLADALKREGMFRLFLPPELGGFGIELAECLEVIQLLGHADASTAWCVAQAAVVGSAAPAMPAELAQEIWGADPGAVVATGPPLEAEFRRVEGGYRLSGRWSFASGCLHATWMMPLTLLSEDGSGGPPGRFPLVPRGDVQLIEHWDVAGMRGTGSHRYQLDEVFVPDAHTMPDFALHRASGIPTVHSFAASFGAVALGVARRAIDEVIALAANKVSVASTGSMRDDPTVQIQIAKAEATWGAARAYLFEQAEIAAARVRECGSVDLETRARLRLAATHAMRESAVAVDHVYQVAGADGIFGHQPLQRCFQDVHVLTQQFQGRPSHYQTVGQHLLGLEVPPIIV